MSVREGFKLGVTMEPCPGQPPLLGDEIIQVEGESEVCKACPLRCGGYVVGKLVEVPVGLKAEPGSIEAGCKTALVEGEVVAFCFHPWKSTLRLIL